MCIRDRNSFSGSALFFDLLNTVKLYPAFTIFLDIGRPIRPMPINPIFFVIYFLGTNSWKFCVITSGKNITQAKTINWITTKGANPLKISVNEICGGATDFK